MNKEFKEWLRKNWHHLQWYAPDEIARVALACGFSIEVICPEVSDNVSHLKRLLEFWESPLSEQWMRLKDYETGMEEAA